MDLTRQIHIQSNHVPLRCNWFFSQAMFFFLHKTWAANTPFIHIQMPQCLLILSFQLLLIRMGEFYIAVLLEAFTAGLFAGKLWRLRWACDIY